MTLEEKIAKLEASMAALIESHATAISNLEKERDELKETINESKGEAAKVKTQEGIATLISDSKLPEDVQKHLTESFINETDLEVATPKVKKEIEVMESLNKGAEVKGQGRTNESDEGDADKDLEEGNAKLLESYTRGFEIKGHGKEEAKKLAEERLSASSNV